jgi:hypothetical protein
MDAKKRDRFLCSVGVQLEFIGNEDIYIAEFVFSKVNKELTVIRRKA